MCLPKKADGTIDKRYLRGVARKKAFRKSHKATSSKSSNVVYKYFNKKTGKYLKRMHPLKGRHQVTGSGFDLISGRRDIFYDEE